MFVVPVPFSRSRKSRRIVHATRAADRHMASGTATGCQWAVVGPRRSVLSRSAVSALTLDHTELGNHLRMAMPARGSYAPT